jgi:DNA-binding CsgD family transcriptional regulator
MRWSDGTLAAVADLAGAIAEVPQGDESRALIALEGVSRLIPFDRAVLCRTHGATLSVVGAIGYGATVSSAVARDEYRHEQKALGMESTGLPMRFRDLPDGGRTSFTVTELAWPAGLHDGMGMSIRSGRGRVFGHIALNATRDGTFSDEHSDLLAFLNRPLGAAVGEAAPVRPLGAFGLTVRELEVLDLIAQGLTNGQIAGELVVSQSTVRRHVEHVLAKLGVASRTAAAVKASRHDLVR